MNALYEYFLQSSLILALFYLAYYLLFRNERFFVEIRIYLVASVILALLLPLVEVTYTVTVAYVVANNTVSDLITGPIFTEKGSIHNSSGTAFLWGLGGVYVTVSLVLLCRSIVKAYQTYQMIKGKVYERIDGVKVISYSDSVPAFTFFETIVINKEDLSNESFQNILAHEKIHVQQKHWIDLLLVELLCIVFWFNPFVWLFQRAVKQTHELLADDGVIARGFNIGQYQAILINQLMGAEVLGLSNNFNYSLNKKRMIMMSKEKCPQNRRYKFLVMVPVILAVLLFNLQVVHVAKAQDVKIAEVSKEKKFSIAGKVLDVNGIPAQGINVILLERKSGKSMEVNNIDGMRLVRTDVNGSFKLEATRNSLIIVGMDEKNEQRREVEDFILKGKKIDGIYYGDFHLKEPYTPQKKSKSKNKFSKTFEGNPVFVEVEEMPEFPGGSNNLGKYINEKIEKLDSKFRIGEKCFITFIVSGEGEVKQAKIIKSTGKEEVDEEALKIVQNLPKWKPGKQRGEYVNVSYTVSCEF